MLFVHRLYVTRTCFYQSVRASFFRLFADQVPRLRCNECCCHVIQMYIVELLRCGDVMHNSGRRAYINIYEFIPDTSFCRVAASSLAI